MTKTAVATIPPVRASAFCRSLSVITFTPCATLSCLRISVGVDKVTSVSLCYTLRIWLYQLLGEPLRQGVNDPANPAH